MRNHSAELAFGVLAASAGVGILVGAVLALLVLSGQFEMRNEAYGLCVLAGVGAAVAAFGASMFVVVALRKPSAPRRGLEGRAS